MQEKHKRFIRERLIPLILREEGNGFAMEQWKASWDTLMGERFPLDDVTHRKPACGTVACIGGSVEMLARKDGNYSSEYAMDYEQVCAYLGLGAEQTRTLCYGWDGIPCRTYPAMWPERYQDWYAEAATPLAKAEVAVRLLEEVIETDGAVLEENRYEPDGERRDNRD